MTREINMSRQPASFRPIARPGFIACTLFAMALVYSFSFGKALAQSGTPLSDSTALYARVVRTAHSSDHAMNDRIIISVTAPHGDESEEDLYAGDVKTGFHLAGSIKDVSFKEGLCCGTLYELPQKVGALEAGTLLWAGSIGGKSKTTPMRIGIYSSRDGAETWHYLSDCAVARAPRASAGGLWEPEFTIAADGALVCFYSDETQPHHSQLLNQVRSHDGVHWSAPEHTVALENPAARPGMPVVTRLKPNLYFMTYEICGTAGCSAFSRTSTDGWNWGDAADAGRKIVSETGQYFEHAPTNTRIVLPNGKTELVAVGQMLIEADGSTSKLNGQVLFLNDTADGSGPWHTMKAPVAVPEAYDNYCPNYSSPLLPLQHGQEILEVASRYADKVCRMYYGTGAVPVRK